MRRLVDHIFRRHYGRMVAGLTRVLGPAHLGLVEDVVQEALLRALRVWPFEGVPQNPRAWLVKVARNLALDALRRRAIAERKEDDVRRWAASEIEAGPGREADPGPRPDDDALHMIFLACHPALPFESRVALTLKSVCGFGVAEIARAFLAQESAIAQRLVRAKRVLQQDGCSFAWPDPGELPRRLDAVLEVLYLLFNEGHAAHRGEDLVRRDVLDEAVRLARLLAEAPETTRPKVHALLALMLLAGARLPGRTGEAGELLTMARQDRSMWDRRWIAEGLRHLDLSIAGGELTPYHVEAAIAACHAAAPSYAETDWKTILARYDQLAALAPSPIVLLNRAVALAKVEGVDAGLRELERLAGEPALAGYHLFPATRGQLLWARGDRDAALACFRSALALPCSGPERELLLDRIRRCESGAPPETL